MRISGVKPLTFLVAIVLILLASSLPQAFASIGIAYDNGTYDSLGGDSNAFAGVMFSLPSGVSSATLGFIRWSGQTGMATGALTIHITQADHMTELSGSPISLPSGAPSASGCPAGWSPSPACFGLDVTSSGIVVTGNFFVIFERTSANTLLDKDIGPGSGHSFAGSSLASLAPYLVSKNLLVRVDVDPISTPPIPEYPIGLTILAIFMVLGYGLIRRRTFTKQK